MEDRISMLAPSSLSPGDRGDVNGNGNGGGGLLPSCDCTNSRGGPMLLTARGADEALTALALALALLLLLLLDDDGDAGGAYTRGGEDVDNAGEADSTGAGDGVCDGAPLIFGGCHAGGGGGGGAAAAVAAVTTVGRPQSLDDPPKGCVSLELKLMF